MSDELVFYTHPMSRGRVVRWMLEEIGYPYRTELLDYASTMKDDAYRAINPMAKVPAIVHGDRIVTETAAICAYLADAFPEAGLAPDHGERSDYYRWLFFAAGPVEAAFSNKAAGFVPDADKQRMFGYGTFERTIDTLEAAVTGKRYIAHDRFTAADIYVGSMLGFMMQFGLLEPRPAFTAYVDHLTQREACQRARHTDDALIPQPQPA